MSQRRAGAKPPSSAEVIAEIPVDEQPSFSPVKKGALSLEPEETVPLAAADDLQDTRESKALRKKQWLESPFAATQTEPTWLDERKGGRRRQAYNEDDSINPDTSGCLCCSALVCPYMGAGRVGNMAVLHSSTEWVEHVDEDEETGEQQVKRFMRPKLNIVMGPYWPMLVFCTYPLILGISGWTFLSVIVAGKVSPTMILVWTLCTVGLIAALGFTSCRDPGILHRHEAPPPQGENTWRWSEQAQSYRPRGAIFDPDTGVVVEEFDHTCPWTGTAIGKKNMMAFQLFVCLVFVCMVLNIFLLTGSFDRRRPR